MDLSEQELKSLYFFLYLVWVCKTEWKKIGQFLQGLRQVLLLCVCTAMQAGIHL